MYYLKELIAEFDKIDLGNYLCFKSLNKEVWFFRFTNGELSVCVENIRGSKNFPKHTKRKNFNQYLLRSCVEEHIHAIKKLSSIQQRDLKKIRKALECENLSNIV